MGIQQGWSIYDFGALWGYGSWQLSQAGYDVYSYEIGEARAAYAQHKLGCRMFSPDALPQKVDYFFSAHVIEHLPDPMLLWQTAGKVLKADGIVVVVCPNGDPVRESDARYHQLWGQPHPLLITSESLSAMAHRSGFESMIYTAPYDLDLIRTQLLPANRDGHELLCIARRTAAV